MPAKRYKVTLEPDERGELEKLISRGKGAAAGPCPYPAPRRSGRGTAGPDRRRDRRGGGGERGDDRAGSSALCRRGAGGGFEPPPAAPALSAQTGRRGRSAADRSGL